MALGKENIKCALEGRTSIGQGFLPLIFAWATCLVPCSFPDMINDPEQWTRAMVDAQKLLQYDWVLAFCDRGLLAEACGSQVVWNEAGEIELLTPVFQSETQNFQNPDSLLQNGHLPVATEVANRIVLTAGKEIATGIVLSGPLALAAQLSGGNPEANLLDYCADAILEVAKCFCEIGVDVIVLRDQNMFLSDENFISNSYDRFDRVIRYFGCHPLYIGENGLDTFATSDIDRFISSATVKDRNTKSELLGGDNSLLGKKILNGIKEWRALSVEGCTGIWTTNEEIPLNVSVEEMCRFIDKVRE